MMNTQAIEQLMRQYLSEHEFDSNVLEDFDLSLMFIVSSRNVLEAVQSVGIELDTLGVFELVRLVNIVGKSFFNMFYESLNVFTDSEKETDTKMHQRGYDEGFRDAKDEMLRFVNCLES